MNSIPLATRPSMERSASKRGLDLVLGVLLLGLSLPVLAVLAAALYLCDRRSPFRRVETVGCRGVLFHRLLLDVDSPPRRRLLGRLTRGRPGPAELLEGLPQLLQVVSGQMSLVGPRPHRLAKAVSLRENGSKGELLLAAPGLVSPDLLAPPDCNELARLEFEVLYLRKASVALDLFVLYWCLRGAGRRG